MPEIKSNVKFDRTRDFIECAEFDRTANGCNKEHRKNPSENLKNEAEFLQLDAVKTICGFGKTSG